MLEIYEKSKNYAVQVIKLPSMQRVEGLDNLMKVNVQGNDCLIGKDSNPDELYLFFPSECQINHDFLSLNNLYRHSELNEDKTQKGFFEDNRRVKTVKFRGVISSGFVIPLTSILVLALTGHQREQWLKELKSGDEFNVINGCEICIKYIKKVKIPGMSNPKTRIIDDIVDSKLAPEHFDTSHLLKNCHKLELHDTIANSIKLHGTSARYYNTLTKRKLSFLEKIAKFFGAKIQMEDYNYVSGSRRVIKSVGFEALPNKNHFFTSGDLWSEVGKEFFEGKLHQGEAIYCEIIGKTYSKDPPNNSGIMTKLPGEAIQHGYTYGLERPQVYIYRISNINTQGVETDLSYLQMRERAIQLGLKTCPEHFYGTLGDFIRTYGDGKVEIKEIEYQLNYIFHKVLLEKPSVIDANTQFEEGFCLRVERYPKPEIYKIKSKGFLLHEGQLLDKEEIVDIEEQIV